MADKFSDRVARCQTATISLTGSDGGAVVGGGEVVGGGVVGGGGGGEVGSAV